MGHAGISGLQNHSIGEIYPWSIVIIERGVGKGYGICQGRNLVTGEVCCEVPYNNNDAAGSFESAHRSAEFVCKAAIERDRLEDSACCGGPAKAQPKQPKQSEELTVCRLILPIVRGSDGSPHDPRLWEFVKSYFCNIFGGFTCRTCNGGWLNSDGCTVCDESIEFEAAGDAAAVASLVDGASDMAHKFDQGCIYIAIGATAKLYYRS